jgi:hypothetical protein
MLHVVIVPLGLLQPIVRLANKSCQKVLLADLLWEKNTAKWLTDLIAFHMPCYTFEQMLILQTINLDNIKCLERVWLPNRATTLSSVWFIVNFFSYSFSPLNKSIPIIRASQTILNLEKKNNIYNIK